MLGPIGPRASRERVSVRHWISEPKLSRVDDSVGPFFLGGGLHSHCLIYDDTSKSSLKAAMSDMTYTRCKAWKNLKCSKTRPYLANIRISKHFQVKTREIHILFAHCTFMLWAVGFKLVGSHSTMMYLLWSKSYWVFAGLWTESSFLLLCQELCCVYHNYQGLCFVYYDYY